MDEKIIKIATRIMDAAVDAAGVSIRDLPESAKQELRVKAGEFASLFLQHLPDKKSDDQKIRDVILLGD